MPLLEEMISHLTPDERRRFRLNFPENTKDSKELALFELLLKNPQMERLEVMATLYPEGVTRNAYDNLRKRVITKISEMVVLDLARGDQDPRGQVMHFMMVAYKFHSVKAWHVVLHFCQRAEEIATQHRMYALLEGIYNFLTQHAADLNLKFEELVEKKRENWKKFEKMRTLNEVLTEIELKVREIKLKGGSIHPQEVIDEVLGKHNMSESELRDPAFRIRLVKIFRRLLLAAKQYTQLEELLEAAYRDLWGKGGVETVWNEDSLNLVYMLGHCAYRNKRFVRALMWLDKMNGAWHKSVWYTDVLYLKSQALRAAALAYSGQLALAIETLEEIRAAQPHHHHVQEWLNIELSLSVYYFKTKQYRKTLTLLQHIQRRDPLALNLMGKEWCFKMEMIELITHCELGNNDLMDSLLYRIQRGYRTMLAHDRYKSAALFLKLAGKVMKDPAIIRTVPFRKRVKSVMHHWELDMGDIQAVTFFCWLKSKLHGREYYEVLLEEVTRENNSQGN